MSILIASPGRSGSAWAVSLLAGCGLSCVHEWTGTPDACPDVVADTSWLWDQDQFLQSIKTEDTVLILDRDAEERNASIRKLLGDKDWSHLESQWQSFKSKLLMLDDTVYIDYSELFTSAGREKLFSLLWYRTGAATGNFLNMYDTLKHMNIRNQTCEQNVKDSYGT